MFFAKPGIYEPCEMFSIGHAILLIITLLIVGIVVYHTKNKKEVQVKKIIQIVTIALWGLEIIKIIFNFKIGNARHPNNYIPLYYCSIILYAGLLSGFAKGILKRVGDVFISTGSIIGGLFFLFCPNTSLTTYPMFHFISIQSFIFHGSMLYLGILVNITNYVHLEASDIKYYASLIVIVSVIAYWVNKTLSTNFMFISENFSNTPVECIYNVTGEFFTLIMILMQALGPFYLIYGVKRLKNRVNIGDRVKANI